MRLRLRNSPTHFGYIAMAFHWLTALFFLGNIALGFYMTSLLPGDPNLFPLFQLHKSVGIVIFSLAVTRLFWRLRNTAPPLPAHMPAWEKLAAHGAHIVLYGILVVMPLTGWIIVSASPYNIPTLFFGWLQLPHLEFVTSSAEKDQWLGLGETAHWLIAWASLAGIFLHAAAALRHHFILRDDILLRMLPVKTASKED
ncbi:MAG: cytochrome b [Parvibaculum sp.]